MAMAAAELGVGMAKAAALHNDDLARRRRRRGRCSHDSTWAGMALEAHGGHGDGVEGEAREAARGGPLLLAGLAWSSAALSPWLRWFREAGARERREGVRWSAGTRFQAMVEGGRQGRQGKRGARASGPFRRRAAMEAAEAALKSLGTERMRDVGRKIWLWVPQSHSWRASFGWPSLAT
ncbi:uncharacterized protein [Oryza sativa Japonica Group]|uniref:Os04g0475900 protein n=4 Tax=Oryza TaxID=4527 RepID=Q0JCE7_ORYSJ|nr:uncharacterized protein LOC4336151 [Oryza sativa Japonica Group]KAB8095751.1 hypothetical protein EE612_023946 [Oryza sativa]BAH58086.1 hypothetical protein [Oryza rufipogon]KAF2934494.1 hypothetical protein DAI22_04g168101 [Oryza sativa Japonica Group]BAF14990.1 Os04g0475900 [Oryza sativa Japonica Group]BAG99024.1 unnamed protein product [Oryza sativa Japonica Group]|eukprot:NP_001053076.1 Os04g0475900 [Oryza sativa Japonica Group]